MHFTTEVVPAELPALIRRLTAAAGGKVWKKRILDIEQQIKSNPLLESYIFDRFALECGYGIARQRLRQTGRLSWPPRSQSELRLYSFAAAYSRVHQRLSSAGQNRLSGMLRGALKDKSGIAPLAQELEVAIHLMSKGFDVEFHDLESGGGFDYLAVKDDICMEIECKFISADIGRKIHQNHAHKLGACLYPVLSRIPETPEGGTKLQITLPDRLHGDPKQHDAIKSGTEIALGSESRSYCDDHCRIRAEQFSLDKFGLTSDQTRILNSTSFRQILEAEFGIENKTTMVLYRPGQCLILVVLESEKPDQVLESIVRHLKASAEKQFSGKNPACLVVHLADLTQDQLLSLADLEKEGTGLHKAVNHILERRPQLHSIAFMTLGKIEEKHWIQGLHQKSSFQETGSVYFFRNQRHKHYNDNRYIVFSA